MNNYDVVVIGSGPGGYVAAIRAAQLGLKVVCIEMNPTLGGTCLNVGCIPSKALLETTATFDFMKKHGEKMGIEAPSINVNFAAMMQRKDGVVKTITEGVKGLFKKNGIVTVFGKAKLTGPNSISVEGQSIEAKNIIIATGSASIGLPFLPFDEKKILSSTGALKLNKIPEKLVVIGAGVIGVELGSVYARLGSQVTFIEALETICGGGLDPDVHRNFLALLKKQGLTFHLGTSLKGAEIGDKIKLKTESLELEADAVLVSIGRKPYVDGLGLDKVGVALSPRGLVTVDERFCTSVPSIYAIGDLIEGPMLAHRASEEGVACAEIISGKQASIDYMTIPSIIYTHPEVATIGFTEPEAKEKGLDPFTGTCSLLANARARCMDDNEGFVKVIGDKASGKLIGMHIVGPHASELIAEGVVAIKKRMTVEELADTVHGHPTLSEAIKEACLAALGRAINL